MAGPWFKFYASDWLAGTRGLTAAETGIYITLVAMMYERRAPLDMKRTRLARLCGCPAARFNAALDALIESEKILDTELGLWNDRVAREIGDPEERSRNASAAARRRWNNEDGVVGEHNRCSQNETDEREFMVNKEAQKSEEKQGPEILGASNPQCGNDAIPDARSQKPEEVDVDARARDQENPVLSQEDVDALYSDVMAISGIAKTGGMPTYWMPPEAPLYISKWVTDLGLTAFEIRQVVREARKQWPDPPRGPKAYEGAMRRYAQTKNTTIEKPTSPPRSSAPFRKPGGEESREEKIQRWSRISERHAQ